MLNKYSFTQQAWLDKNKEHSEDFKRWSKILGVEIKNLDDLLIPSNNVYYMTIHSIPLPGDLTKEDRNKMIAAKMYACVFKVYSKRNGFIHGLRIYVKIKNRYAGCNKGRKTLL